MREVILEWCATGQRPGAVKWLAVNEQQWDLDGDGNVVHSYPGLRQTVHYVVRDQVVREYGWGTDRSAPTPAEGNGAKSDHRTGRTQFGTVGPDERLG
jgi:hypothetical protein